MFQFSAYVPLSTKNIYGMNKTYGRNGLLHYVKDVLC